MYYLIYFSYFLMGDNYRWNKYAKDWSDQSACIILLLVFSRVCLLIFRKGYTILEGLVSFLDLVTFLQCLEGGRVSE